MAFPVPETNDLVLDRRTIPRTDTSDRPRIHGGAAEIGLDDLMGRLCCACDTALYLGVTDTIRQQRERNRLLVGRLHLE